MSSGYITFKCPRCSSTIEIISSGINSNLFLCPVCLEGEIKNNSKQSVIEKKLSYRQVNQKLGHYVIEVANFATN